MEAFEGERKAGAVAEESLNARSVVARDADGSIDAEAAGSLLGGHAFGVGLIEKAVRSEVPEDAPLNDALKVRPVRQVELDSLAEADRPAPSGGFTSRTDSSP